MKSAFNKILISIILILPLSACQWFEKEEKPALSQNEELNLYEYIPADTYFTIYFPISENSPDPFVSDQFENIKKMVLALAGENNDSIIASELKNQNDYQELENTLSELYNKRFYDELFFKNENNFIFASNQQNRLNTLKKNITENENWQIIERNFEDEDSIKLTFLPENLFQEKTFLRYGFLEIFENEEIKGKIISDQEKMDAINLKFNDSPENEFYLYKSSPKENLSFLMEGFDLKSDIEKIKNSDPENFEKLKEEINASIGINIENDVISWMNEGYLLAVYNNNFQTQVSLIFDVKSNPEKAQEFLSKVNDFINSLESLKNTLNIQYEYEILSENTYKLSFDNALLNNEEKETNLIFGLSEDNLLFFSNLEEAQNIIKRENNQILLPEKYQSGQNLFIHNHENINKNTYIKTIPAEYHIDIQGETIINSDN